MIYNGQVRRQIRADRTPQELADLVMAATRGYNFDWASMNGDYDLMSRMQQDMPILFDGFSLSYGISVSAVRRQRGHSCPKRAEAL